MARAIYGALIEVMALGVAVVGLGCLIFAAPPLAWAFWGFQVAATMGAAVAVGAPTSSWSARFDGN